MLAQLEKLRYRGEIGFQISLFLKRCKDLFSYRIFSDAYYLKKQFRKTMGMELNLINPRTLNEKIQWFKIHERTSLQTICADKLAVRNYIKEKIGEQYLIKLIYQTKDYKEVRPDNFPDQPFIIKTNHGAGTNHIVKDKNKVDWDIIKKDCRYWLKQNYYFTEKEWQYKNIVPEILVEELLIDDNGEVPLDYKLHYFNGKFEFLVVDIDRFIDHKRNLYDADWNLLPFTWSIHKDGKPVWDNGREIPKPKVLEDLIALGGVLAKPFNYVRIDFYVLKDTIYFGELTFHHGGGFEMIEPVYWDQFYGDMLQLPKAKKPD